MHVPLWPPAVPVRVVYVVDEPLRKGFAYGTLPGHPETGEEAFIVEYRDDDSVWLTIRAFSRPSSWIFWVGYPIVRLMQEIYTSRYERALSGPIEGEDAVTHSTDRVSDSTRPRARRPAPSGSGSIVLCRC